VAAAVLPVVFGAWLAYRRDGTCTMFALLLNVAALYLTMGFRQRSHFFTDIHLALKTTTSDRARDILSAWRQVSCAGLDREAVTRLAIEEALVFFAPLCFAVVFWFVLLPGPTASWLAREDDSRALGSCQSAALASSFRRRIAHRRRAG